MHLHSFDFVPAAVSGKSSQRRRRSSVDRSLLDSAVNMKVYRCFYPQCIPPTPPPPATLAPLPTGRPADFMYVEPPLQHVIYDKEQTSSTLNYHLVCFSPVGGLMHLSGPVQLKITLLNQQRALMWSSHQVMSDSIISFLINCSYDLIMNKDTVCANI